MKKIVVKSIRWDITSACNLTCLHCFSPKNEKKDINFEQVIKIIEKIIPLGLKEINFSGREPTLRKDMFRIIRWCHEKNIITNITTNATLLNPIMINQIMNSGINMLVISLDGPNAVSHDKIRGNGNFEKTKRNLRLLKSNCDNNRDKLKIGVSCTLQRFNIFSIQQMINLCDDLCVHLLAINPVSFCGSARNVMSELYVKPDDIISAWENICKQYSDNHSKFELYLGLYPMEAKYLNLKYNVDLPVIQTGCAAGKTIYINAQGHALPCYMLPPISVIVKRIRKYLIYWDVLNENVQHAARIFEPFVDFALKHNHENFQGCKSCSDLMVCKRCPLISISDPEALKRCQIARNKIDLLKAEYNDKSIIRIKPTVKHQVLNNRLLIKVREGSYKCDKTYELGPFAKHVWKEMNKSNSIYQLKNTIKNCFSELTTEEKEKNLHDCIDYFFKEGVIIILNKANEKKYLD